MTSNVMPLPFKGDLIDYLKFKGHRLEWLWRDGEAYIPAKPICDILGIAWQPQHRKLTDPEAESGITFMVTPDQRGRPQEHLCIAYPDFMMWLATITPRRVKAEARDAVRATRNEIRTLIANHYHDRLFGESRAATLQLQALVTDWVAMRPIRGKVVRAVDNGWTFEFLRQTTSYTKDRLTRTIREALRIGAIAHAPAGTPLAAVQFDLFSEV